MRSDRGTILRCSVRWLSRRVLALARLLYKLEVQNFENLPHQGPLIILGRHSSRLDFVGTAFLSSAMEEFYGMTGAIAVHNNRFLGLLARQLGVLTSFKVRGLSAASLMEAYKLLQQGKIIFTGPEGEISWDGRLQPLRPGAAWLALRAHAPVVVLVGMGAYDIFPRWARRPHLTGKLVLRFGKPFYLCDAPCERVTEEMLQEANRRVRAEMERLSDESLASRDNVP